MGTTAQMSIKTKRSISHEIHFAEIDLPIFLLVDNDRCLPCGRSCWSRSNTDFPPCCRQLNATRTANGPAEGTAREARMKIGPGDLIEVNCL